VDSGPYSETAGGEVGREQLPHRSTLSPFLAALDQTAGEALGELFLEDLCTQPLTSEKAGRLWHRQGTHWLVFDVDGIRQAARQRALFCVRKVRENRRNVMSL
jgi:hypothetical protein